MMRKPLALLLLLLVPVILNGRRIDVLNQSDFDLMQHSVDAVLSSGDTLVDVLCAALCHPGADGFSYGPDL